MKSPSLFCLIAATLVLAGCHTGGHHSTTPAATTSSAPASALDTSALVAAFKNADIPSNQVVQSVVSALSNKDYSGALTALQKLNSIPGLTAAQASSIQQLIGSIGARGK